MCTYRVTDDAMFTDVDREYVLLHISRGEYFSLNEMGRTMFDQLRSGFSRSEIIELIISEYNVDQENVSKDLERLIEDLLEADLLIQNQ